MPLRLLRSNSEFARTEVGELAGELGLVPRLVIPVLLYLRTVPQGQHTTLGTFAADVRIVGQDGTYRYLGRAEIQGSSLPLTNIGTDGSSEFQMSFGLSVDRRSLESLEALRLGREFRLRLEYHGLAWHPNFGFEGVDGHDERAIRQVEWLAVLAALKFRRAILFEVAVPEPGEHPTLETAIRELDHANAALSQGRARDAVGACRRALEALAHAVGERSEDYKLPEQLKSDRSRDKRERFAALRRALTLVAHPAAHGDPTSSQIEWHYDDALALIAQTAAVLNYHVARLGEEGRGV